MAAVDAHKKDLVEQGRANIAWATEHMPVMARLREKYEGSKPLHGQRIAGCLHVTKETAVLINTLRALGADVSWCGCNPLSTQDDIAAALAADGVDIHAWYGMTRDEFYEAIDQTIMAGGGPTLTLDDGADLILRVHSKFPEMISGIKGGSEETTTGVNRLRAMATAGALKYPIIAVNDSETKHAFDNVYGTGQSTLDGVIRATNTLLAGKTLVVAGYGNCGSGLAAKGRGMGCNVIVTEVDHVKALKAVMDGFTVMPMDEAAYVGDIFITATGMKDVITYDHFVSMKAGSIVCNTGHYDAEINIAHLDTLKVTEEVVRPDCKKIHLNSGGFIYLLAEGRLVNLAAAEGHPSEVMDMSFANQVLAMMKLAAATEGEYSVDVHSLSKEFDSMIAETKLQAMRVFIDKLSAEQIKYQQAYEQGT